MRLLDGITSHGHEFEQAPGVGDGQGSQACCSPQGLKKSDTTEQLKRGYYWGEGSPSLAENLKLL